MLAMPTPVAVAPLLVYGRHSWIAQRFAGRVCVACLCLSLKRILRLRLGDGLGLQKMRSCNPVNEIQYQYVKFCAARHHFREGDLQEWSG